MSSQQLGVRKGGRKSSALPWLCVKSKASLGYLTLSQKQNQECLRYNSMPLAVGWLQCTSGLPDYPAFPVCVSRSWAFISHWKQTEIHGISLMGWLSSCSGKNIEHCPRSYTLHSETWENPTWEDHSYYKSFPMGRPCFSLASLW